MEIYFFILTILMSCYVLRGKKNDPISKSMVLGQLLGGCLLPIHCFGMPSVEQLTLEEKIGQLLIVHFHGREANEEARALVQDYHVGGIIFYNWANGLDSPQQVSRLTGQLQALAVEIPLLLAVDQEGGVVTRLSTGFTQFPGNRACGMAGDPALAEQAAWIMGQELVSVGINLNLAPVVDIHSNPKNPVIGIRAFGDRSEDVTSFARAALNGYNRAGILTCLKHFPGHGDVDCDSHFALPSLSKSLQELEEMELKPFYQLLKGADTVMSAHLLVPQLDLKRCATLSPVILSLLRKRGFEGPIISDSLVMGGVLNECHSIDEAAIRALEAGCDLLLLGGKQLLNEGVHELSVKDIAVVHGAIFRAVQEGRLSKQRIDESAARILKLKGRISLSGREVECDAFESRLIAQEIAARALRISRSAPSPLHLKEKAVTIFAPESLGAAIEQTSMGSIGARSSIHFFNALSEQEILEKARAADLLLIMCANVWKDSKEELKIHSLLSLDKPAILLILRDPLDAELFPEADRVLTTFSPTAVSLQAACDFLWNIEMETCHFCGRR